jgi:exosome complex RNA-binding protein Rrp42 (RNase PH superfamily)
MLSDLCITEYRAAWELTLELVCMNDEGCLEDACLAAAVSTLRCIRLPPTTTDDQGLIRLVKGLICLCVCLEHSEYVYQITC